MHSVPEMPQEIIERIAHLRRLASTYRSRYGHHPDLDSVTKTEERLDATRRRLGGFLTEAEDLSRRIVSAERQITALERWLELTVEDAIEKVREMNGECWSPQPVVGFRIWRIVGSSLLGARHHWPTPEFEASCDQVGGEDDMPHSDGRCGRLGCGVYVTREFTPEMVYQTAGIERFVVGLVELSGKVIEHDRGYRGERARCVAVVAFDGHDLLATSDDDQITVLFAQPTALGAMGTPCSDARVARESIKTFLIGERERREEWTLENRSG